MISPQPAANWRATGPDSYQFSVFGKLSFIKTLAMVNLLISVLGFILILLLLTEEFRDTLRQLWRRFTSRPRGKYLAYPVALVLGLAAVGLIGFSLWFFVTTTFSYD